MDPAVIAAIIAAGASVLTLIGTLAAQRATSRDTEKTLKEQSKQLSRTLAEQRTRTLNERFATAADQLGNDKPAAVRLAGVYAMTGLADDWEENRQTCVDVLCGYLRMPYSADPGQGASEEERLKFASDREVRHTVVRVIAAHLIRVEDDAAQALSWRSLNFDFTGVVFDGQVNFDGAEFWGAWVSFDHAKFSGDWVSFSGTDFFSTRVSFDFAEFSGDTAEFYGAKFRGVLGKVSFDDAEFSGDRVSFDDAEFSGDMVSFNRAKFSSGTVDFGGAEFSGYVVSFSGTEFSGGTVDFGGTKFSGSTVDFSDARDWSVPPKFPKTGTLPSDVKLPQKQDQPPV
jgi:hypothetical protein